eukprot:952524-Rhodomonas_salina.1
MDASPVPASASTPSGSGSAVAHLTTLGAASLGKPQLDTAGFPKPVSFAALGVHEADVLAGRSILPGQSRDPLTPGGAPHGVPGLSTAIGRTLLQPSRGSGGKVHPEVHEMLDFMVTVDQRDALRAGDDSRHGLVVTLMESQEVVRLECRKVKTLRSRLLG